MDATSSQLGSASAPRQPTLPGAHNGLETSIANEILASAEASPAKPPSTPRRQFGLQQVMLMIASVAVVLAIGTQLDNAGWFFGGISLALFIGLWWSWYIRDASPALILGMLLPLVFGLLVPTACCIPRSQAQQMACQCCLRSLTLALQNYADHYNGHFPPAYLADANGKPLHSWRVLILPYIEQESLYQQYRFDEPWDSKHNLAIAKQIPYLFQCPSRSAKTRGLFTSYVAVVGDETMWPAEKSVQYADVTDGLSRTLCLIEWPESDVIWTEPRDFDIDRVWMLTHPPNPLPKSKQFHSGNTTVGFADGHIETLRFGDLPGHKILALLSRASQDNAKPDERRMAD